MFSRRVVKRRPACLTDEEWLQAVERGKLPRPDFQDRDGSVPPPVDVYDLVFARQLSDLRWRVESLCMAMLEPVVPKKGGTSSSSTAKMGELLSPFSELWEFLSSTSYASGKPRLTGHLSLRLESEGVKVTLTDPTTHSYVVRVAPTLEDCLLLLDIGLKDGTLKWLPSSFGNGKK